MEVTSLWSHVTPIATSFGRFQPAIVPSCDLSLIYSHMLWDYTILMAAVYIHSIYTVSYVADVQ